MACLPERTRRRGWGWREAAFPPDLIGRQFKLSSSRSLGRSRQEAELQPALLKGQYPDCLPLSASAKEALVGQSSRDTVEKKGEQPQELNRQDREMGVRLKEQDED